MSNAMGWIVGLIALVVIAGGGYWVYNNSQSDAMMEGEDAMEKDGDTMMKEEGDTMMEEEGAMMEGDAMAKPGSYEAYAPEKLALAEEGDVVLFFRATWCPTCHVLDADIRAHLGDIPEGLTILDVDYDTSAALKQKYGVTYQHTLVQVDAAGRELAKWSGSPNLTDLVSRVI